MKRALPQVLRRGAKTYWNDQANDLRKSYACKYYSPTTKHPNGPCRQKRTTRPRFRVGFGMDSAKPIGRKKRKIIAAHGADGKQAQLGHMPKISNNLYINLHTSFERKKSEAQIRDSQRIYVNALYSTPYNQKPKHNLLYYAFYMAKHAFSHCERPPIASRYLSFRTTKHAKRQLDRCPTVARPPIREVKTAPKRHFLSLFLPKSQTNFLAKMRDK